jgi:hypothetical protein
MGGLLKTRLARGRPGVRRGVLVALALILTGSGVAAQTGAPGGTYDLALRDVTLGEALREVSRITGLSVIHPPDVGRDTRVWCRGTDRTAEELLRCVVESAGVDFYRLSSGTYVIIADARDAPGLGDLAGQVVDGRTGEPVPGATIRLDEGPGVGFSDDTGRFVLTGLLAGSRRVRVWGPGYQPALTRVEVAAGRGARVQVQLERAVVEIQPLVVDGLERRAAARTLGSAVRGIDDREDSSAPRSGVLERVRSTSGVVRRPLFADLHLQGSRSGEVRVELDGAPVFEPVSLGRLLSAFSPLAIRRVTLRKAGFGVSAGSYLGGVLDVEHALGTPAGGEGLVVQVDPFAVDGAVTLPIRAGETTGRILVAGRRSLWDVRPQPALDDALRHWNGVDPVLARTFLGDGVHLADALEYRVHAHGSDLTFSDLHGVAELELGNFRSLDLSVYRGTNDVGTESFASGSEPGGTSLDRLLLTRDRYRWTSTAGRARFAWLPGSRTSAEVGARISRHQQAHRYRWIDGSSLGAPPDSTPDTLERLLREELEGWPVSDDGNRVDEVAVHGEVDVSLGPGHRLSLGLEAIRTASRFHLDDSVFRPLRSRTTAWRGVARVEDRWVLGDRLTLDGGIRFTWLPSREDGYAEPRLALRWDAPEGPAGPWSLRVAAGLYRQFVNRISVASPGPSALVPEIHAWLPSDGTLAPPRARHLSAQLLLEPAPGWQLRAEGYLKEFDRILATDYGAILPHHDGEPEALDQRDFLGEARGRAWGGGVSLRYAGPRLRVEAGYDRSVSERTFPSRFDDTRQPVPWNVPHTARLGAEVEVTGSLVARAESRSSWDRPWGLRRAYYDILGFHSVERGFVPSDPGGDRLPVLHEVDVGLQWSARVRDARVVLMARVQNVLNRENVLDYSVRRIPGNGVEGVDTFERVPRFLPGIAPLVTLRVTF